MRAWLAIVLWTLALWVTCSNLSFAARLPDWIVVERIHGSFDVQLLYERLIADSPLSASRDRSGPNDDADLWWRSSPEPGTEGEWAFFTFNGGSAPESAIRRQLPAQPPYRVRVELYCEGEDCDRLRSELEKMRAPLVTRPPSLRESWRKIVAAEPCDPLIPAGRTPLIYPREEQRQRVEGTVVLSVFHNRCGDVRDVNLAVSSGAKNLDRAALTQSRKWRVPPVKAASAGWKREVVQFRLDDPALTPLPGPIDVR